MRRFVTTALMSGLVLMAGLSSASAQASGNIEGRVIDDQNRPIVDAVVHLMGRTPALMARTNASGFYVMKDVPAGTQTIRADATGMKTAELTGLRVLGGQTVTQDFKLDAVAGTSPGRPPMTGGLLLRFQLIQPIATRTTDKSIASIDSVLRDLFQWNGYRLLSAAAIASDIPGRQPTQTGQYLDADGTSYKLSVVIDSVTPQKVRMMVTLTGYTPAPMGNTVNGKPAPQSMTYANLLTTTVTVSFGHTVVLGTTQTGKKSPTNSAAGTLILVVKPEMRAQ